MAVRQRSTIRTVLLALVVLGLFLNMAILHAGAAGSPANKAVASGRTITVAAPQADVVLMSATMRTSAPKDLIMTVNLECTILTALVTNNDNGSATAVSTVQAWIEFDGEIVPIQDVSSPGDHSPGIGKDADKVTFCNREYSRTVTDKENPADGIDEIRDYISTKSAHSFQWVLLNAGSGVHTIEVHATLSTDTDGQATAEAVVGNRVLTVEPTHFANDAIIN